MRGEVNPSTDHVDGIGFDSLQGRPWLDARSWLTGSIHDLKECRIVTQVEVATVDFGLAGAGDDVHRKRADPTRRRECR